MVTAKNRFLSKTFRENDICYHEIYAPDIGGNYNMDEEDGVYYINMTIVFWNSRVYLNNGTDFFNATNETIVGSSFGGVEYSFLARGNRIYLTTLATGSDPSTNATIILWKKYDEQKLLDYFMNNFTNILEANLPYVEKFAYDKVDNGNQIYQDFLKNQTYI